MKQVTFIHAADLHLDSPMVGLKHLPASIFQRLQESTFTALMKIVDLAIQRKVDFIILAGDLFDGEDRSVRAQSRFRKQMERLATKDIEVFVIHGNHDHMDGKWTHFALPKNVHVFSSEVEVKTFISSNKVCVNLYGFSYPERHVLERKVDQYQKHEGADLHIGILHGHFDGNSEHGKYAPFSIPDLVSKQFDYWALGHIHTRAVLAEDPPIIYPGNIQGRNRKELGMKGCYFVNLSPYKCDLEFSGSSDVIWTEEVLDGSGATSFTDLYTICRDRIEEIRSNSQSYLCSMTIKNLSSDSLLREIVESGELLVVLQDEEKDESSFVWPYALSMAETKQWQREDLAGEAEFYQELFSAIDGFNKLDECVSPLYQHPSARRFLQRLSENEQKELVKDAESILVKLLYKM
jgi:DNA repair exonuclease SbcCD nuclease subunit